MMTWTKKILLAAATTFTLAAPAFADECWNHQQQPTYVQPSAGYDGYDQRNGYYDHRHDDFWRRRDAERLRHIRMWERMRWRHHYGWGW